LTFMARAPRPVHIFVDKQKNNNSKPHHMHYTHAFKTQSPFRNRTTSKVHQNHVFKGPGRSGFVFGMHLGLRSRMITLILRKLLQTRLGTFLDLHRPLRKHLNNERSGFKRYIQMICNVCNIIVEAHVPWTSLGPRAKVQHPVWHDVTWYEFK
jgi:hypothetical protein